MNAVRSVLICYVFQMAINQEVDWVPGLLAGEETEVVDLLMMANEWRGTTGEMKTALPESLGM